MLHSLSLSFRSWIAFAVLDEHLVRRGGGGAADGAPSDYVSRPEGKNDGLSSTLLISLSHEATSLAMFTRGTEYGNSNWGINRG